MRHQVVPIALALALLGAAGLWHRAPVEAGIPFGTFTVDTTADDPASDNCTFMQNDCSLRGAIILANTTRGEQTIAVPAGTYLLTSTGTESPSTGDLDISGSLTITVSANQSGEVATISGGNAGDRVFDIDCSAACTVDGSNLKIINGGPLTSGGGGLLSEAGGGILIGNANVTLNLDHTTVTNNTEGDGVAIGVRRGAGIANNGGTLRLSNSTVSNNLAQSPGLVGQVNYTSVGAGIWSIGTLVLTNTTISGNTTDSGTSTNTIAGAGLFQATATATVTNSTVVNNSGEAGGGGGIHLSTTGGALNLRNTTVANNQGGDCDGSALNSLGNNNDSDDTCDLDQPSDIPGTDPDLGGLALHGGLTANHVPMAGSPLLDKGSNAACNALTDAFGDPDATDQRGKPRKAAGDLIPGIRCDIGAAEFVAANCNRKAPTLVGTNGPDSGTGTSGDDVVVLLGGDDDYDGAGGNDDICGGNGTNDQVKGGGGADALSGGAGGSDDCFGGSGGDSFIGGSQAASGCEAATSIP
ncbi:MAG: choice-of-anchor Q domain-containing protein [Dehalococcoidia bacterium]